MKERILVNGGEVFDGDWDQLDDCFGLRDEANLYDWCEYHGFCYWIVHYEEEKQVKG